MEPVDSLSMKHSWPPQVKLPNKRAAPSATAHLIHGSLSSTCKPGEDQAKEHAQRHDNIGYVGDDRSSVNHRLQSTCSLFINENTLEGKKIVLPWLLNIQGVEFFAVSFLQNIKHNLGKSSH